MADSINDIKKWFNGLPSEGVEVSANNSGVIKFWFNGLPSEYVFVAGTATVTSFVPKLMLLGLG